MKKVVKIAVVVLLLMFSVGVVISCIFVLLIGPWFVYDESEYGETRYFEEAMEAIDQAAPPIEAITRRTPFQAGWSEREITPEPGHPMAGYGGRPNDKRATGVHEPLYVRALALHNGAETMVIIGADMLQTFPNILEEVEKRITKSVGLTNRQVYYTSSHTHGGPGGFGPGIVGEAALGAYVPEYLALLAERFAEAVTEAVHDLAPARFAHGMVDVPAYIRNRSREGGMTDSILHGAVFEKVGSGERLYLARYSAHCTVFSEEMLAFNNDYAGAFQRAVKARTGMPLLFMAGAVGAMRPNPPGPPVPAPWTPELALGFENAVESALVRAGDKTLAEMLRDQELRAEAMGGALADRLLDTVETLNFEEETTLASMAIAYSPPPAQVRPLSTRWRLSPFAFKVLGAPTEGRLQALRLGSMFLIGVPYDFGGEISKTWQQWATERGINLWVTSFSGAYLGYLSPDRYYNDMGDGFRYNHNYEIGLMNWFGPNQEAYVTDLFQHSVKRMVDAGY